MKLFLSAEALGEIRSCMNKTAVDTFRAMFYMDSLPVSKMQFNGASVSSYIEMNGKKVKSVLSVSLTLSLAEKLALIMNPGVSPPSPAIVHDIAHEITNIISNRVRALMKEKLGIIVASGLPRIGLPPKELESFRVINSHYRIQEEDNIISLSFIFAPQN